MSAIDLPVVAPTRKRLGASLFLSTKFFLLDLKSRNDPIVKSRLGESALRASFFDKAKDFVTSDFGRALYLRDGKLSDWIDDHRRWSECGSKTVAFHYMEFMKRQQVTARQLFELSRTWRLEDGWHDDLLGWYTERAYATHDLAHVLFGYDFDNLGELCIMACIEPNYPSAGISYVLRQGTRRLSRTETKSGYTQAAFDEARRNGRRVPALWEQDIDRLMRMDLCEARTMLGIRFPEIYEPPEQADKS